ncbi:ribosome biogenesis GTP-binding protein YihA/YsxC [Gammaproteobacteria bacterium]|jgi:GTP-binding protein|nr:ribosome biogenesis GTP-binding protein YihA/YsxC [Gammaproteobacteria bacterium]MDA8816378.1 ribosome biogenesis GTP-binding protein YihA/YsxC [Gammaproteobacteria bacterium]MDA9562106.1 ribosome biogenesis GTP-binding protein YihA/YsxC [Gammaproteobacteria bacterium]MDA9804765.1 ribosome biogenesis GTP-binding protein YihA/YsxC [Gammaproteobacteria bacterium]MDB2450976.1 ribosome biogenesis GTP-binding protein YihA/YsxC [Gammaproteobacteria bacterium]
MKNLFKESEFMLGVTKFKNLPDDVGNEILLAGRSNAGKSSALNALTGNPKLARISKTPGRTTEINFFKVNDSLKLVDLPGYGFAKSSFHKRKDWAPLLEEYFLKRESLKAVVIFMDIRHPLKDSDRDMINLCNTSNAPFIPVLTKSDKMSNNQRNKSIAEVNRQMEGVEAIAVSSKDILGFDKLSRAILEFVSA